MQIQDKKWIRDEWRALLWLTGATLLFFWPIWIAGYTFPQGGGDLFGQLYHVWSYVSEWLRRGIFALWDTRIMGGDPIVAEAQYGLFNPLNWPLFLFSPIPKALLLFRDAFTIWLAGVGLYLYLRRSPVWRLSRTASLVGATAYMLSNPFVTHLGHPQFNDVMAWLPWVLWSIDHAMRASKGIPFAGVALGALLLAGHGQAALYAVFVITAYSLWQILEAKIKDILPRASRLVLVAAMGGALAAPSLMPLMERLPYTDRNLVPEQERQGYEFPKEMTVDLLTPNFHGQGARDFWPAWDRVESGYAGAAALYLALLGVLSSLPPWHIRFDQRQKRTWFLVGLAGFAYLFALGYSGPLYPRVDHLPFFADLWKTARIVFLISFTIAIAAAQGVEQLLRGDQHRNRLWALLVFILAIGLWVGAPSWVATVPNGEPKTHALEALRFAAITAGITALAGWITTQQHTGLNQRIGQAGLLALLLVELVTVGAFAETDPPQVEAAPHQAALDFLNADPGWFRVDVDVAAINVWSPSLLLAEGFEMPQGTGNPMEIASYNQFYWSIPYKGSPAYQILGVKYIIVPKDAMPGGEGIWPAFTEDELVDIHLNTRSLNRIWLVYNTQPVSTREEAQELIFEPSFDPQHVATIENGPELAEVGEGALEVLLYGPNRIKIKVQTSTPTLLVLSDILYPGWKANLDGKTTTIYPTNALFKGVVVPAGEHIVEMTYFPSSLRMGLGLTAMALLTLLVGIQERRYKTLYNSISIHK